jgi:hypothetical protein
MTVPTVPAVPDCSYCSGNGLPRSVPGTRLAQGGTGGFKDPPPTPLSSGTAGTGLPMSRPESSRVVPGDGWRVVSRPQSLRGRDDSLTPWRVSGGESAPGERQEVSRPEHAPLSARPAVAASPRALTTHVIAFCEFTKSVRSSMRHPALDHRLQKPALTATKHRETSLDMNDADPMSHPPTGTHEKSPQNTDDANRVPTTKRKRRTPFRERIRGRVHDPRNRVPRAAGGLSDASSPRPAPSRQAPRESPTTANLARLAPNLSPLLRPRRTRLTNERAGHQFFRPEGSRPDPRSRRPRHGVEDRVVGPDGRQLPPELSLSTITKGL